MSVGWQAAAGGDSRGGDDALDARSTTPPLTLFARARSPSPLTKNPKQQVRNTAVSPEGLEEYLEFRAGTDLRWPYA